MVRPTNFKLVLVMSSFCLLWRLWYPVMKKIDHWPTPIFYHLPDYCVFLLKACRGKKRDSGRTGITPDKASIDTIPIPLVPTNSDVLIFHSTDEGCSSYRELFFPILSETILKYCHLEIMEVRYRVTLLFCGLTFLLLIDCATC